MRKQTDLLRDRILRCVLRAAAQLNGLKRAERGSFEQRDSIAGELSMSKIAAGTELSQKVLMMGVNEALDRYASH